MLVLTKAPTFLLPALLFVAGCVPASTEDRFGGLDANGDGMLRPADLEPGAAAVYLWRTPAGSDAAGEAHRTAEAQVIFEPDALHWILRLPLQGVPEYVLHVPFDPDSGATGPAVGTTEVLGVSIDVPAREHYGDVAVDGPFTVTESNGSAASGWVELDVGVSIRSYVQDVETGEHIRVVGIAFSGIEVSQ